MCKKRVFKQVIKPFTADNRYENLAIRCGMFFELFDFCGENRHGRDVRRNTSVFDIARYAFARMVADVAPPADVDMDYDFSQSSILTCMCCGEYFIRNSICQRYCDNPNCKVRAYYKRKKADI